uniref:Uncharacterized protein n=1 Tax=Attheya septentrionalis TaxID=420275 RepID=A0A6T7JRT9_9STRA|mmetsp:Transcript_3474/g.6349  ORF Transcript_3474/g.6349 Transcript_3474/m.6349 type:complete len:168 (+) Transcript_3474:187-690(+)|eukprot:CAMPEP_0198291910 /NCGR_PEP_ID=MMETSP1449-20131203/9255_1 /TAXON_ID=420275 /ORGANISM="Attheya septentrionalis, Strain CCMP2084" /LENGTH=167 /DNA_ID=CAMNT_0043990595 /DNA_START=264 /DNA_END=767 /DNA_ORIENTATION=+
MSSHLDVPDGSGVNDIIAPISASETTRRPKRSHSNNLVPSSSSNGALGSATNHPILALPFFFLIFLLETINRFFTSALGAPIRSIGNFVASDREQDKILRELPGEQRQQQEDMSKINLEQEILSDKVRDLRRRVRRLEERRAQRAGEATNSSNLQDGSTATGSSKTE